MLHFRRKIRENLFRRLYDSHSVAPLVSSARFDFLRTCVVTAQSYLNSDPNTSDCERALQVLFFLR